MTVETIFDQSAPLTAALVGPRPNLDARSHIATLACVDVALAGSVAAARYVAPALRSCTMPRATMRKAGDPAAVAVSELLFGEQFALFDIVGDWGFGRSMPDRYTGWIELAALGDFGPAPDRRVTARVAPVFAAPDIKAPVVCALPFGARVTGADDGAFCALAGGGWLHLRHVAELSLSPLSVARRFEGAPYLWGGRTPMGVDCSGLVQAAFAACRVACPRDSDQQRQALGQPVDFDDRQAGDVVFFPGHVGLLVDADTLLHANAYWMATVIEPLADVVARGAEVTGVRRVKLPKG